MATYCSIYGVNDYRSKRYKDLTIMSMRAKREADLVCDLNYCAGLEKKT